MCHPQVAISKFLLDRLFDIFDAMITTVTDEQIAHYQREGYLIVENFLDTQEVADVNAGIDACIEMMGDRLVTGKMADKLKGRQDSYYKNLFLQKINLWRINKTILDLFINPALGEMLCTLADIDGIRVFHDQLLEKPAWGNPTSWHLDNPNWIFHSCDAVSMWIALTDVNVQNGCMYYMPGSHKAAAFDRKGEFSPNVGAIFEQYPEWKDKDPVPVILSPGDVALHNGMMAHAAGPNMTPRPRRAMTCAFMPDGAIFSGVQDILTDDYAATLKVGDVLDNDEELPLLWRRA